MMNIDKVLEILNNGEYIKLEERYESSDLRPYSETSYTASFKEGGVIRITQVASLGISYKISLFIPNKEEPVESWTIEKYIKCCSSRKTIKDPLYDEVSLTFYNLEDDYSMKKIDEYSEYFPQQQIKNYEEIMNKNNKEDEQYVKYNYGNNKLFIWWK